MYFSGLYLVPKAIQSINSHFVLKFSNGKHIFCPCATFRVFYSWSVLQEQQRLNCSSDLHGTSFLGLLIGQKILCIKCFYIWIEKHFLDSFIDKAVCDRQLICIPTCNILYDKGNSLLCIKKNSLDWKHRLIIKLKLYYYKIVNQ